MSNKKFRSEWWFLFAVLIVGLWIRLDFLVASDFVLDADEAIVGLMAKHIHEGRDLPVFYYGQAYMGSLEPIVASGFFSLVGVSSAAVKAAPLLFSLLLIILVYALTELLAGVWAARVAAVYLAVPPLALVEWSARARGGFVELIVIGVAALITTVLCLREEKPSLVRVALTGTLLGLGWWVNNQIIFFIGPIGLFFLLRFVRLGWGQSLRALIVGLAAFIFGGLPFWTYNLQHDWASFEIFNAADARNIGQQFAGLFRQALPIIIGAKRFWQNSPIFPGATAITWCVVFLPISSLLWLRRNQIVKLFRGRIDRQQPIEMLMLFVISTCVIFAVSSFGSLYEAPRYLLPLYAVIPVLFGLALTLIKTPIVKKFFVCAVLILNLCSNYLGGRAVPGEPFVYAGQRVSHNQSALISFLKSKNIFWVRTNYWIGYRLAFESNEEIRFVVSGRPAQTRIAEYLREGIKEGLDTMPFVLVPAQAPMMERALQIVGTTYERAAASNYVILYNLKSVSQGLHRILPVHAKVEVPSQAQDAGLIIDGSPETRWGTGRHQEPGMKVRVTFDQPTTLRGLAYDLASWPHDYPRGLQIDLILQSGERHTLIDQESYVLIREYLETSTEVNFHFDPLNVVAVELTQLGTHPVFDWSIAELEFFD